MTPFPYIFSRTLYFVFCQFSTGVAVIERDVTEMDRASTVAAIRDAQITNVRCVIECSLDGPICNVVTDEILLDAGRLEIEAPHLSPSERLIAFQDHMRDHRKNWVS